METDNTASPLQKIAGNDIQNERLARVIDKQKAVIRSLQVHIDKERAKSSKMTEALRRQQTKIKQLEVANKDANDLRQLAEAAAELLMVETDEQESKIARLTESLGQAEGFMSERDFVALLNTAP